MAARQRSMLRAKLGSCCMLSKAARSLPKTVGVKPFLKLSEAARVLGLTKNKLASLIRVTEDGKQLARRSAFAVRDAGTGNVHVFEKKSGVILSFDSVLDVAAQQGTKKSVHLELDKVKPAPTPSTKLEVLDIARQIAKNVGVDEAVGGDGMDTITFTGHESSSLQDIPSLSMYSNGTLLRHIQESAESTDSPTTDRVPVVCILGHINHGKTTFLDYVAQTDVASFEVAGITQHIRAVQVDFETGDNHNNVQERTASGSSASRSEQHSLTFIDTPGHVAFSHSRFLAADAADLCVILCAADEGPQQQTLDALHAAVQYATPILMVITKADLVLGEQSDENTPHNHNAMKAELQRLADRCFDFIRGAGAERLLISKEVAIVSAADGGSSFDALLEALLGFSRISPPPAISSHSYGEALVLEINRDARDGMALSAVVSGNTAVNVGDFFVAGALHG